MTINQEKQTSDIRQSVDLLDKTKDRGAVFLSAGPNYEYLYDPPTGQLIDLMDTYGVKAFLKEHFPAGIERSFRHRYTSDFQIMASKLCTPVTSHLKDPTSVTTPKLDSEKPYINRNAVRQFVWTTYVESYYQRMTDKQLLQDLSLQNMKVIDYDKENDK